MATKAQTRADMNSCWNRAAEDEPVFVLKASDPIAAETIRFWARSSKGVQPGKRVAQARADALEFEAWRKQSLEIPGEDQAQS